MPGILSISKEKKERPGNYGMGAVLFCPHPITLIEKRKKGWPRERKHKRKKLVETLSRVCLAKN
jgi:hypothetical protein